MPGRVPSVSSQAQQTIKSWTSFHIRLYSPRVQKDWAGKVIRKRHETLGMMEMAFYTTLESLEEHHLSPTLLLKTKQTKARWKVALASV